MDYCEKYFRELSKRYKNTKLISSEIVNLQAILNLPKGTEHFVSDIHGEYEMFLHILKTASGVIRRKIDEEFGPELTEGERASLASLIYYPREKLEFLNEGKEWHKIILYRLVRVCKCVAGKYTRSKVRKLMPSHYSYIMDELLNCDGSSINKDLYYNNIIETIVGLDYADDFIIEMCNLIQTLAVDHLHIVGDIFDRGPRADIILDYLHTYRSLDIQWGNHDVLWIGAALGNAGCILTILCDCFKYGNLALLSDGYGINLIPLYNLVNKYYKHVEFTNFKNPYNDKTCARLLKATLAMRFKVEDSMRIKYPEFGMYNQTILDKIDFENGTWSGFPLRDTDFPTINPIDVLNLVDEEKDAINSLIHSFVTSERLQKHIDFLMNKGSLYLCYNGNLLFHGCIPLKENGEFMEEKFYGKKYKGKNYLDYCEVVIRRAYKLHRDEDIAFIWQLWCGNKSPIFGKDKMATFERQYVTDPSTHLETKQYYFSYQENEDKCREILEEFGLNADDGHIINGHVPVKQTKGESPIKANGKMIVIDGGMSKPYQKLTGIAGYTLTYHSYGLSLAAHAPFLGVKSVVESDKEVLTEKYVVARRKNRMRVSDIDEGVELRNTIKDLYKLLELYRDGTFKEHYDNQ
ncbi:MAG: fructose-1,6-bisphosphatase [Clostridia bacterium]